VAGRRARHWGGGPGRTAGKSCKEERGGLAGKPSEGERGAVVGPSLKEAAALGLWARRRTGSVLGLLGRQVGTVVKIGCRKWNRGGFHLNRTRSNA